MRSFIYLLLLTAAAHAQHNRVVGVSDNVTVPPVALIFSSGFEGTSAVINQTSDDADITGLDGSYDWVTDLEGHSKIGNFEIQYQGGAASQRLAEIVNNPKGSGKVLKFWIKDANLSGGNAGRVQANVYNNVSIYELRYSARLYLPDDFNSVKSLPSNIWWLTLMEFWNNANWTAEGDEYRMSVNLVKNSATTDSLYIEVKSQTYSGGSWQDPPVWEHTSTWNIPVEKWMTVDIYIKEGDVANGRFEMIITPDGESPVLVHDITNVTHHPSASSPNGLGHFNPLKLYTNDTLIDHVQVQGDTLQVYWGGINLSID